MSDELTEWLYNPHSKPAEELSKHDQQMIQMGWDAARQKPLPTNEEIHLQIVNVLFDYISVPEFREWLVEKFR